MTDALSAGLLLYAGGIGLAEDAYAADPFPPQYLYGTGATASDQPSREIYQVDKDSGAIARVIAAPSSAQGERLNQIGVSTGGAKIMLTSPTTVYEYTAATETWEETPRGSDGVAGTMGGVSPVNDWLYYGGWDSGSAFTFAGYNPDTNTVVPNLLTATLPDPPGANGDLAFDRRGDMYVVVGGDTQARIYRIDAPAPTTPGRTTTGVPIGPTINGAEKVNSMAFGDDGYLYLYGGASFMKVDPATGLVLRRGPLTPEDFRFSDLGSWATPPTTLVRINLPDGRARPGDQFRTELTGGGISTGNTGTTTGSDDGIQNQERDEYVGPLPVLPNTPYTITQTGVGDTSLQDYTTTWQCVDVSHGSAVVAGGEGNIGTFTMPNGAEGSDIDCTFTAVPKPPPVASDDQSRDNPQGTAVGVPVLRNDRGDLEPATVRIIDPNTGQPVTELVVPGEGAWTTDPTTGNITFTPDPDFTGNPTPVDYRVADETGKTTDAKVTVTYVPVASDDRSLDNTPGTLVTIPVLDNDKGDLDPSSVRVIDPKTGQPVTRLVVPGEGQWTTDPATGDITFTPEPGSTGNPTPIDYQVADRAGRTTRAQATVTYRTVTPTATPVPTPTPGSTTGQPSQPAPPAPPAHAAPYARHAPAPKGGTLPRTGGQPWLGTALVIGTALTAAGAAAVIYTTRRRRG